MKQQSPLSPYTSVQFHYLFCVIKECGWCDPAIRHQFRLSKMVNLLDGIRKLKERRQEAAQAISAVTIAPDDMARLITLYETIGMKSEFVRCKDSTATAHNKQELERMEKSFNYRWTNLSADKQEELVGRLLDEELVPDTIRHVLDAFDGSTVVSLV